MELILPARPDGGSHAVGFGVVVAVHLVIGYALVSGLAKKVVDSVREPLEARLIDDVKKPPPPPPAPVKPRPKLAAPPPPFVPPPEVSVAPPPVAPTIVAVTPVAPPAPVEFKPEPPPAPAPPPAPKVEQVAIGVACPTMVKPVLPRRAAQEGIAGLVQAQATIRGGKVVDVQILQSRPRGLFDAAVRTAMLQYGCQTTGADEIVARQTLDFRGAD
jgi:protein TonB